MSQEPSRSHEPSGAHECRIVGATVVTQDEERTIIPGGEIALGAGGRIAYVGPARGAPGPGDVDATRMIALPGLVNTHSHAGMTLLRGYSEDRDLLGWLGEIRAFEVHMDAEDIAWGMRLAVAEMLRAGITSLADMFAWDETLLAAACETGMRLLVAPAIFGEDAVAYPAASSETGRGALERTEALASAFRGEPRVRVAYGPHAPYSVGVPMLTEIARRAEQNGLPVQIHLAETEQEVARSRDQHGCTPIALAERCGVFDAATLAAHCVHVDEHDITVLAERRVGVAHNPVSNLKLGSGIAPVPWLREAGVRVGLGTDGAASNNDLDLLEELKCGLLVQRGVARRTDTADAAGYLDMATCEGAAAAGFGDVGRLRAGWRGDVVLLSTEAPHAVPVHDAVAHLAYAAAASDVRHVFVDGQQVVRDGEVTTIDVARARSEVTERASRCARAAAGE